MTIRISDSYLSSILVGDMNRSLNGLLEQQRMAGSMQRVNSYADDPRAVSSMQRLTALIAQNGDYLRNISRSRTLVDGTDIALQDLSEILADARVIALRESSSLANAETMTNSATEVDNLVNRMMEVLNSSIEGHFLFAGRNTATAPFVRNGNSVVYVGDTGEVRAQTGPNSTMVLNIPGDIFMGSQNASLAGTTYLAPALRDATLLSDLNQGDGWEPGRIQVITGTGTIHKIDFSGALTVGDVIAAIENGTRGEVTAAIAADGSGLVIEGQGPLAVSDADGGTTAQSLGLVAKTPGGTLSGTDIRALPDNDTLLSDIPALNGHVPLGTLLVNWKGAAIQVDLGGAVTLGNLRDRINTLLPGMDLVLQDGYLQAVGPDSESFSIGDADNSGSAAALGLAGEGVPVRLFGVMEDLQAALNAGDKDAVHEAVTEIMALSRTLTGLLVKTGGRQNDLDWAEGILRQRDERLQSNLSLERDVDVARVATDLSRAQASYQASLLVTSKLFENNLMQYLR